MNNYTGRDIVFVLTTKDRPEKVKNTLDSLVAQTEPCGRVIVVASGRDIGPLVRAYEGRLRLEYHLSSISGQMRQRNVGISRVPAEVRLVGFLDDDIILRPNAIERLLAFWNTKEPETAGVAFNIVELVEHNPSLLATVFRRLFPPGRVYRSGFSVPFIELKHDVRSQRLNGGATIWRRGVLDEFPRRQIDANWAICEDLIFSYPIGKKYPMYACADARVVHDHPIDRTPDAAHHRNRGRVWALWQLYFVTLNSDLSKLGYALTVSMLALVGLIIGTFVPGRRFYLRFYLGMLQGATVGLRTVLRRGDLEALLKRGP